MERGVKPTLVEILPAWRTLECQSRYGSDLDRAGLTQRLELEFMATRFRSHRCLERFRSLSAKRGLTPLLFAILDHPAEGNGVSPAELIGLGQRGSGILEITLGWAGLSERNAVHGFFALLPGMTREPSAKALVRVCEWVIDEGKRPYGHASRQQDLVISRTRA